VIGLRIALQTQCLAQPLRQALHTASRLGAEGIQLNLRHELPAAELSDTAVRHLRKLLDDLNLRVGSTAFPTRQGYATPHNLERRLQATIQAMQAASKLASPDIRRRSGRVSAAGAAPVSVAAEAASTRSTLLEALTTLAAAGNRLGVQIAIQCPSAHPDDLLAFMQELPEGLVGADLSPADVILHGRDPRRDAQTLGQYVAHVFANDAVGGTTGGQVELGRGVADLPEVLAVLEEHSYRGWVTVERRHSPQPVEDAANAIAFLRSL
jgi:sugar phosphate isomerase/epimerase